MSRSLLWIEPKVLDALFVRAGLPVKEGTLEGVEALSERPRVEFPLWVHDRTHRPTAARLPSRPGSPTVALQVTPQKLSGASNGGVTIPLKKGEFHPQKGEFHPQGASKGLSLVEQLPATLLVGPMERRLQTFVEWLVEVTEAEAAFLADEEGLALASFRASDEDIALSAALYHGLKTARRALFLEERSLALEPEQITLRLEHMFFLGMIWVNGFEQLIALGLLSPLSPKAEILFEARDSLLAVLRCQV